MTHGHVVPIARGAGADEASPLTAVDFIQEG